MNQKKQIITLIKQNRIQTKNQATKHNRQRTIQQRKNENRASKPGAQGFGRQQRLTVTDYKDHHPEQCEICCQPLNTNHKKAHTAFETVDIEWADKNNPGLRLTNTKHTFYEIPCACGHGHSTNTLSLRVR